MPTRGAAGAVHGIRAVVTPAPGVVEGGRAPPGVPSPLSSPFSLVLRPTDPSSPRPYTSPAGHDSAGSAAWAPVPSSDTAVHARNAPWHRRSFFLIGCVGHCVESDDARVPFLLRAWRRRGWKGARRGSRSPVARAARRAHADRLDRRPTVRDEVNQSLMFPISPPKDHRREVPRMSTTAAGCEPSGPAVNAASQIPTLCTCK